MLSILDSSSSALSISRPETLTTLREAIAATDATLGGTEMNKALQSVFALGRVRRKTPPKAATGTQIQSNKAWTLLVVLV